MILRLFFFIRVEEFYKNATLASSSSEAAPLEHFTFTTHFYKIVDLDVQSIFLGSCHLPRHILKA